MDEHTIQENLKQNIQREEHIPAPAPAQDEPAEPAFQSNITLGDPIVSATLTDYFDLSRADKYSEERQRQLKTVLEWAAAEARSNDLTDILLTLQRKEVEIGRRPFQDRLQALYKLAKLHAHMSFINNEMRSIYGAE